jgi:hypothetical protein
MVEAALSLRLPAVVRTAEPFVPDEWPPVILMPDRKILHERFNDHIASFEKQDLDYFEALVFLRADRIARPHAALMRAPAMNHRESCEALVQRAVELAGGEVEAVRERDPQRAGKILAYMIAALCGRRAAFRAASRSTGRISATASTSISDTSGARRSRATTPQRINTCT